jgi:hypothetical protein
MASPRLFWRPSPLPPLPCCPPLAFLSAISTKETSQRDPLLFLPRMTRRAARTAASVSPLSGASAPASEGASSSEKISFLTKLYECVLPLPPCRPSALALDANLSLLATRRFAATSRRRRRRRLTASLGSERHRHRPPTCPRRAPHRPGSLRRLLLPSAGRMMETRLSSVRPADDAHAPPLSICRR